MRIVVTKETVPGERRVAIVPESCKQLIHVGFDIAVEAGAGDAAGFTDEAYQAAGAAVMSDPAALVGSGDLLLKVNAPFIAADACRDT
jgi:proton-translocating NAD(P)+ transhydrogenase subunit alpha